MKKLLLLCLCMSMINGADKPQTQKVEVSIQYRTTKTDIEIPITNNMTYRDLAIKLKRLLGQGTLFEVGYSTAIDITDHGEKIRVFQLQMRNLEFHPNNEACIVRKN